MLFSTLIAFPPISFRRTFTPSTALKTSRLASSWESFDYSENPKAQTFTKDKAPTSVLQLPESSIHIAISLLSPFLTSPRLAKLNDVLSRRDLDTIFLFENPTNPSNVYACLRTLDSFGIQNSHVINNDADRRATADPLPIRQPSTLTLKQSNRGARTAAGAAQWVSVTSYPEGKSSSSIIMT